MGSFSVEVVNHTAIVTFERAPINSLVKDTYRELQETFEQLGEMDDVRVAVLRARGRFFCPGNEVTEFQGVVSEDDAREYAQAVSDAMAAVYNCKVPVVAAVHGHAYGAGMALAACADVIVASEEAEFGIPEIKVGIIGASAFMALLVPEKVARYLSLTGRAISAHKVAAYGGVQEVVPTEQVFDAAMDVARDLLKQGPTALRYFKEAMNINQNALLVEKYATEAAFTRRHVGSPEFRESVNAFVERREAEY